MAELPEVGVTDNLFAPEVFADLALSFFVANGNVRITFTSMRSPQGPIAPGPAQHVVVGRLVMPVAAAQTLAVGLHDFLEQQGLSPTAAMIGGATAQ